MMLYAVAKSMGAKVKPEYILKRLDGEIKGNECCVCVENDRDGNPMWTVFYRATAGHVDYFYFPAEYTDDQKGFVFPLRYLYWFEGYWTGRGESIPDDLEDVHRRACAHAVKVYFTDGPHLAMRLEKEV